MEKDKKEKGRPSATAELEARSRAIEADIENLRESLQTGDKRKERIEGLLADLRAGREVTDFRFDDVFPLAMRELSGTHWTPVEMAVRAASLLATGPKARILDIGSGCGKFCLIGALTTPAIYVGIEQRGFLVEIAKATRDLLQTRRVVFSHGNMAHLDWTAFDGFYLYNPFYEHQVDTIRIDRSLAYSEKTFDGYVRIVKLKLAGLRRGARVATYHGFGGTFPPGYRRLISEPGTTGPLELWEKVLETPQGPTMMGCSEP